MKEDWPTLWNVGKNLQTTNGSSLSSDFSGSHSRQNLLSSVPIKMSQSSSPLLREEIEVLLQKRAVERVQDPGIPGFYFRIVLVPKKNGKLRPITDLSLLN